MGRWRAHHSSFGGRPRGSELYSLPLSSHTQLAPSFFSASECSGAIGDPFVLHMFAALAETEPALIFTRTRQALAAAKARGMTLGSPKLHVARRNAQVAITAEADRHAANVLPIIREAQKAGATTLRQIAEALNARGVPTARGGQWHAKSVSNILERA